MQRQQGLACFRSLQVEHEVVDLDGDRVGEERVVRQARDQADHVRREERWCARAFSVTSPPALSLTGEGGGEVRVGGAPYLLAGSGTRMSSAVPSFLSGPKLTTAVSSSSQMILYGWSHASVILDDAAISFWSLRSCAVGQSLAWFARQASVIVWSVIAACLVEVTLAIVEDCAGVAAADAAGGDPMDAPPAAESEGSGAMNADEGSVGCEPPPHPNELPGTKNTMSASE